MDVERPSPHPVSHFAALNVSRPTGELRSSRTPPGEGKQDASSRLCAHADADRAGHAGAP
ncbi:hypothetical protein CV770_24790 [Bradyrhizobium sp. AC87j1]|nr:hypothetical protein CV770_24790 [Bradyrhizobium sp. AC87j1]